MDFWGFRANLGRIWTVLYLSPTPRTAEDLCRDLQLSTGSVSMAIQELVRWGAVIRTTEPGGRRSWYQAHDDILAVITRVMEEREVREINHVVRTVDDALVHAASEVAAAAATADEARAATARWRQARLQQLAELAHAGDELVRLLLERRIEPIQSAAPPPPPAALPKVRLDED